MLLLPSNAAEPGRVYFGAIVELESDSDLGASFQIGRLDEFVDEFACISVHSPVARTLLGRMIYDQNHRVSSSALACLEHALLSELSETLAACRKIHQASKNQVHGA